MEYWFGLSEDPSSGIPVFLHLQARYPGVFAMLPGQHTCVTCPLRCFRALWGYFVNGVLSL